MEARRVGQREEGSEGGRMGAGFERGRSGVWVGREERKGGGNLTTS